MQSVSRSGARPLTVGSFKRSAPRLALTYGELKRFTPYEAQLLHCQLRARH